jgi:hypothetical protein
MHQSAWVALLRHIPPEQYDQLAVVTTSGTEICVQGILRIEQEFLAFKGRLAGSQDAGRLFFLPYERIDYLGFQRPVKDAEFAEMFGGLTISPPVNGEGFGLGEALAFQSFEAPAPAPEPDGAANGTPPASGSGIQPAIRSVVLERFRARGPSSSAGTPSRATQTPPGAT